MWSSSLTGAKRAIVSGTIPVLLGIRCDHETLGHHQVNGI